MRLLFPLTFNEFLSKVQIFDVCCSSSHVISSHPYPTRPRLYKETIGKGKSISYSAASQSTTTSSINLKNEGIIGEKIFIVNKINVVVINLGPHSRCCFGCRFRRISLGLPRSRLPRSRLSSSSLSSSRNNVRSSRL